MNFYCKEPDRDVPGITCGHPLPCPYHTVIIQSNAKLVPMIIYPVTAVPQITPKAHERLKRVAIALQEPARRKKK